MQEPTGKSNVLTTQTVIRVSKNQVSTSMGKETVLLQMHSGKYFSLNRVGSFVWQQLQGEIQIAAIVDATVAKFEVDRSRCEADVLRILTGLLEAGFLESC